LQQPFEQQPPTTNGMTAPASEVAEMHRQASGQFGGAAEDVKSGFLFGLAVAACFGVPRLDAAYAGGC
jgi:hypothetical protein